MLNHPLLTVHTQNQSMAAGTAFAISYQVQFFQCILMALAS